MGRGTVAQLGVLAHDEQPRDDWPLKKLYLLEGPRGKCRNGEWDEGLWMSWEAPPHVRGGINIHLEELICQDFGQPAQWFEAKQRIILLLYAALGNAACVPIESFSKPWVLGGAG